MLTFGERNLSVSGTKGSNFTFYPLLSLMSVVKHTPQMRVMTCFGVCLVGLEQGLAVLFGLILNP